MPKESLAVLMVKGYISLGKILYSAKLLFTCKVKQNTFSDMQRFEGYTKNVLFL